MKLKHPPSPALNVSRPPLVGLYCHATPPFESPCGSGRRGTADNLPPSGGHTFFSASQGGRRGTAALTYLTVFELTTRCQWATHKTMNGPHRDRDRGDRPGWTEEG